MKNVIIIVALLNFRITNAQKGTVLIGGFIGAHSVKNISNGVEQKINSYEFSPKIGYQFSNNFTSGIETTIGNSKNKFQSSIGINTESKIRTFNLGAFLVYTKSISDVFYWFGKLSTGLQTEKLSDNSMPSISTNSNGFYLDIEPGVFIHLNKGFGLNFFIGGLRYNTLKNEQSNIITKNELDVTFGKVLKIGISKNLQKNKTERK